MTSPYIETYGITEQEYNEVQTQYENKSIHLSGPTMVRGLPRKQSHHQSTYLAPEGTLGQVIAVFICTGGLGVAAVLLDPQR